MTKRDLGMILALAIALSCPALSVADDGGGDDRGQDNNATRVDNHGNDNNAVQVAGGGTTGTTTLPDDHGNNTGQDDNRNADNSGDDHGQNGQGGDHGNAGNAMTGQDRLRVVLSASAAGVAVNAEGSVEVRRKDQRQRLKVEVEADVPDGMMFNVSANGIPLDTITMQFGEGEIELDTEEGKPLPGSLMPSAVTLVAVTDLKGNTLLQAQFGSLDALAGPDVLAAQGRKRAAFVADPAGLAINAHGEVETRTRGQRERIKVEVEADVADGAVFKVFANGIEIGTITIHLGEGELELDTEDQALPQGLDSVSAITTVRVTSESGTPVLDANL